HTRAVEIEALEPDFFHAIASVEAAACSSGPTCRGGLPRHQQRRCTSVEDLEAELCNHRVGENFLRYSLDLLLRVVPAGAVQFQDKELALPDVSNSGIAERSQRVLDGLALRV